MKKKEAERIIREYKPHKGFYNLSEKPKELSIVEYAQILDSQNLLIHYNQKDKEYLKEWHPYTWEQLKEFSAMLQGIIMKYWEV